MHERVQCLYRRQIPTHFFWPFLNLGIGTLALEMELELELELELIL